MCCSRWKVIAFGMDISLGAMAFSTPAISVLRRLQDMMAISDPPNLMVHVKESIFFSYNSCIYMSTYQGHLAVKSVLASTI